jgi:hypothetical protein
LEAYFFDNSFRADEITKEIQICFILVKKKEEAKESSKLLKELFETKRNGANVKVLRGWQGQSVNISLLIKLLYSSFLLTLSLSTNEFLSKSNLLFRLKL